MWSKLNCSGYEILFKDPLLSYEHVLTLVIEILMSEIK